MQVARDWGRIGCIGFGGPPTHISLLCRLCVDQRGWLDAADFEDAIAACNMLPGPASTQLAIYCAWRVRGRAGAAVGGLAVILPGLVMIVGLSVLFLTGNPPIWVQGAGAGAGAAVAAVAMRSGWDLLPASWRRSDARVRWAIYLTAGGLAAAFLGPRLVLVLLGCGVVELARRRRHGPALLGLVPVPVPLLAAGVALGGMGSLAWVALKVGALSYGGGFVIIPLMQADAIDRYHWMTDVQFTNAVALGQITPGPVVLTVAVVGYAAAGLGGALLATAVAFSPSFAFILVGGERFDRMRSDRRVQAFLGGAGPAAAGAILGSAIPLARAAAEPWQLAVLVSALLSLLVLRRDIVPTLLVAGLVGAGAALAGGAVPA